MATPRKLYQPYKVLIDIARQTPVFVKAFDDEEIDINSWQVMTLLTHMISYIHIPEDKRRDVINTLFDLWDETLIEKNMPVQAFRKFVLKQLPYPGEKRKNKRSDISAHLYLEKIIIGEINLKEDLENFCITDENYDIAIKFALIFLSRMIIPAKEKTEYFKTITKKLKNQERFHHALFTVIYNQQL